MNSSAEIPGIRTLSQRIATSVPPAAVESVVVMVISPANARSSRQNVTASTTRSFRTSSVLDDIRVPGGFAAPGGRLREQNNAEAPANPRVERLHSRSCPLEDAVTIASGSMRRDRSRSGGAWIKTRGAIGSARSGLARRGPPPHHLRDSCATSLCRQPQNRYFPMRGSGFRAHPSEERQGRHEIRRQGAPRQVADDHCSDQRPRNPQDRRPKRPLKLVIPGYRDPPEGGELPTARPSRPTRRLPGRQDLADQEKAEIAVLERGTLPKQMDETATKAAVAAIVAELGAAGPKDMEYVMGAMLRGSQARWTSARPAVC